MIRHKLYCVRHGTAQHNIRFKEVGSKAFHEQMDTHLVPEGIAEAIHLSKTWRDITEIELVVVSPLSRALQTADLIFKEVDVPIVVLEDLIEFPQHKEICNKRAPRIELQALFPKFDFKNIEEFTQWNTNKEETHNELRKRCQRVKKWLSKRSEKKICLVSHSSFLQMFLTDNIVDTMHGIKHCIPLEIVTEFDSSGHQGHVVTPVSKNSINSWS